MNKKVLTLCAGFLLAGGMLSSLSAEKLTVVADNGKYYKLVRMAYITGDEWVTPSDEYCIDLKENVAGIKENPEDLWKVVSVENGYQLINFEGTPLDVNGQTVFNFNEKAIARFISVVQVSYDFDSEQENLSLTCNHDASAFCSQQFLIVTI